MENQSNLNRNKPTKVKPSLYAYIYFDLKNIAYNYGYNLVLHGSLSRDLDLIAIPWQQVVKPHEDMIDEFIDYLGGTILMRDGLKYTEMYHGRINYIIDLNRNLDKQGNDLQYYLDISITPIK